jgi:3-oxoacyl-[acyl-carrier protein] reductase
MTQPQQPWVVVSGAGGALGNALAMHYADKGDAVLGLDRRLDRLLGDNKAERITVRSLDISREQEALDALDSVLGQTGRVRLLINAVGQIWNEPLVSFRAHKMTLHSFDSWRRVMEANLTAPFIMATLIAGRMVRTGGGSIVNFSSIASGGNAGQAAYGAAKAGIEGLTRAMAAELGPLGVRVNALTLGFIDVETTREALTESRLKDYV